MPYRAQAPELRLALLSLFSLSPDAPLLCRSRLDRATALASSAPDETLIGATPEDRAAARLGAARVLNSLCAACHACSRGRDPETVAPVMLDAPPP